MWAAYKSTGNRQGCVLQRDEMYPQRCTWTCAVPSTSPPFFCSRVCYSKNRISENDGNFYVGDGFVDNAAGHLCLYSDLEAKTHATNRQDFSHCGS